VRTVLAAIAAVLVGLALYQVTMQPSGSDRLELGAIYVAMAMITALAAIFLPALAKRSRHLVLTLFALSLITVGIAVFGLVVAASRMFVSDHDLTLLLVVLGFGLVAALGFAVSASGSLTDDLHNMAETAHNVAAGDLSSRTDVHRADEIGALARDLDEMASRLETAATARAEEDARRREFFAAVGHDLRTPLASMQAAVEALKDGIASDPQRFYRSIESDVVALNELVDDLFLLARIQAGDMHIDRVPTDLTDVADEAIEVVRPVADKEDIDLRLESSRRIVVDTGPHAVSRILRNLLDNAIRHAPSGSTVRIAVDGVEGAVVSVLDDGPGFSEEFIATAFDSFSRSDSARARDTGGAGLGLAIAQGFVEALDGKIWAEPGPGGRVTFTLP
jgi:signal transduction histidine kinase